eukprot:jgi/Hompol1/5972/HPOL_000173-RA
MPPPLHSTMASSHIPAAMTQDEAVAKLRDMTTSLHARIDDERAAIHRRLADAEDLIAERTAKDRHYSSLIAACLGAPVPVVDAALSSSFNASILNPLHTL